MKSKAAVLLILMCLFGAHNSRAQEYNVHSLFIYSFLRYIEWPQGYNSGNVIVAVLGDSPIMNNLENMARVKKINGRSIEIRKFDNIETIGKCHILFVPAINSGDFEKVLEKTSNGSTLVVTETPGLGKAGSSINFVTKKNGKPGFELNEGVVHSKQLKIATELTSLAIRI
ncbi:MAG: YfiR family protein [Bacteroidota bacterium]